MGTVIFAILVLYMAFSVILAVFNLYYLRQMERQSRQPMDTDKFRQRLLDALEPAGEKAERRRIRWYVRAGSLGRFKEEMRSFRKENPALADAYFKKYAVDYMRLLPAIRETGLTERTIYARFVAENGINRAYKSEAFARGMIDLMDRSSMFLIQGVLCALASMGMPDAVDETFKVITERGYYCYSKNIAAALMKFSGPFEELLAVLIRYRHAYSVEIQCAILQVLRRQGSVYAGEMLALLKDESEDAEVRIEALRYLLRYPIRPAADYIASMISESKETNWVIVALGLRLLADFPGPENRVLLEGLADDPIWYVRQSAANSLEKMKKGARK